MGLEVQHVLSDEPHHGAFLCAICTNLSGLDALVTTQCSHVFCRLCLETWLSRGRSARCPTCNQEQSAAASAAADSAMSLRLAQPVAYRVLSRIQVSCPLRHVHCSWKGDYGDLQTHLLSSTAHVVTGATSSANNTTSNSSDHQQGHVETIVEKRDMHGADQIMYDDTSTDLAKSFKEEANTKFASNNFREARDLYTKGIDVLTKQQQGGGGDDATSTKLKAILYANRAATASKLEEFGLCVDDCNASITLDATYIKAYTRRYKASLEMGRFQEAVQGLEDGCAANLTSTGLVRELQQATMIRDSFAEAQKLLQQQQQEESTATTHNAAAAATAQQLLSSLLQHHTKAPCVVLAAARAHLQLGGLDTAQRLSLQLLRRHPHSFPEAYLVRGHSLVLGGDLEQGLKVIREGLRLDPDCNESKILLRACKQMQKSVLAARHAIFHRQFREAVEAFGRALEELQKSGNSCSINTTPLYAKLHAERAEAHLRLKDYKSALQDASIALYACDDLEQAWLIKTKAYHGLGRHKDARDELQDLLQNKWGANHESIRKAYERADFLLRKEQRPNFYKLLGLSSIASLMEIKKQYKVKALEYHPDKWVSKAPQLQKEAEQNFKMLGQGLEVLSDDFQRQLYDEGYDPEAIRERVAAAQQAAHRSQNRGHHGHHGGHGGGGHHQH